MNPKEELVRAIDAYVRANAHTSGTRAVVQDLQGIRDRVAKEANPVARQVDSKHGLLDNAPMLTGSPEIHVHVHN